MSSINVVQLDGLVLLKILNHCGEHAPEVCTGNLLGLDVDGRLEITSCFPMPTEQSEEDEGYQLRMMQALRTVNVDNNAVGWYSSAYMGTFLTQGMIEAQYDYQKQIPNSVVIVYDPLQTTKGRLALKAFRLTQTLMDNYDKKQYNLTDVSDVYQEVAIKVHNSHLVHGFLYELREEKSMSCDYDRLSLSSGPVLESHLLSVSSAIDEYQNEQSKFQYHQRAQARQKLQQQAYLAKRAAEQEHRAATGKEPLPDEDITKLAIFKPMAKPSRLDSFLISNQIHHLTTQINNHAAQGFNKLYIVDALHKTKTAAEQAAEANGTSTTTTTQTSA